MKKNRKFVSLGAVIVITVAVAFCLAQRQQGLPASPVTIRCLANSDPGWELSSQNDQFPAPISGLNGRLAVWCTNHTQKSLSLNITQIEVRVGTTWTNYPLGHFLPELRFFEGNNIYSRSLHPYGASRGIVHEFEVPETSPWRFRISVSENLVGVSYFMAGIKESLAAVFKEHRVQNPFARGLGYLGQPREVVSEEIDLNPSSNTNLSR